VTRRHRCTGTTKAGTRCTRWPGTVKTPLGYRCANHARGAIPRRPPTGPKELTAALEALRPALEAALAWLAAHGP